MSARSSGLIRIALLSLSLAACGGGSGGGTVQPLSASVSTGAITAFGSVFVNGHEFGTAHATVTDDDTGAALSSDNLEVGMVVTVKPASDSTDAAPEAAEIHVSPLARGFVDSADTTGSTIMIMGQVAQVTSGTVFSDHRACVSAATPCSAINGMSGLAVTSGTTPGSFVAIHGYLFTPGAGGSAQIITTLVSVLDYNSATSIFKVEGQAGAVDASKPSVTIGAEVVDLSHAVCRSGGIAVACTSAFKVGDVVAALGAAAPTGAIFAAAAARTARLLPQTPGATVEVEGKVSSVAGTMFVVRGIQVDGSALSADQIPAVGDKVELVGTVAADGLTVTATRIEHDEHAAAARVVLAGPLTSISAGATAGTFNVVVLGQTVIVSVDTHIADRTSEVPTTFNITNFETYLGGKTPYVVLRTVMDSAGALRATGFDIVRPPKSGFVGVAGAADAPPSAPVAGVATVTVHGVSVLFNPAKATVSQGSLVLAKGALSPSGAVDTTVTDGRLIVIRGGEHGGDHEVDICD